jgi:hypothetical protein
LLLLLQVGVVAHVASAAMRAVHGAQYTTPGGTVQRSARISRSLQSSSVRSNGTPPQQREGKQQVAPEGDKEEELEFQDAKRALKVIYGHSDSDSSTDEHHKQLHVMYGGS